MIKLLISLWALSSLSVLANDNLEFLFSEAKYCGTERRAYNNLSNRSIRDLGNDNYVITGSLPGYDHVIIKIRRYVARGSGGFGPSYDVVTYSCSVEHY